MQPLRLIVPGSYWDSQIYMGRLYLFSLDGSLFTLNWDEIVHECVAQTHERLAFVCAFQRSDYLYGGRWQLFFADPEVTGLIRAKFERLANEAREVPQARIDRARATAMRNPMPFPHADCTIYGQQMYVGAPTGVFRGSCNKRTVGPISGRPRKICDLPTTALSASYFNLALAAGSEGLWQYSMDPAEDEEGLVQVSEMSCSACEWNYQSIFSSSYESGGYLAAFSRDYSNELNDDLCDIPVGIERRSSPGYGEYVRRFEEIIPAEAIFDGKGYAWGCGDKICQTEAGVVKVARYTPWADSAEDRIRLIGEEQISAAYGRPVAGSAAVFGTVVEFENGLVVLTSDGQRFDVPGEPVNWRTFPRSKHYTNHLHVVYDDRLEILSFNHDYFMDQSHKLMGIRSYTPTDRWQAAEASYEVAG